MTKNVAAKVHALEPDPAHDIDLEGGQFKKTSAQELEQAFNTFIASGRTHLCVFFHGGLVSRADALQSASHLIDGYTATGSYPFFFIWNSDLLTIIKEKLKAHQDDPAFVDAANLGVSTVARKVTAAFAGKHTKIVVPRRLVTQRLDLKTLAKAAEPFDRAWAQAEGLQLSVTQADLDAFQRALLRIERARKSKHSRFTIQRIRGSRNPLARIIQRLNSGHGHGLFTTVIEEIYIAIGIASEIGRPLWDRMKVDIDNAFANGAQAGGTAFLAQLRRASAQVPNLRITLIGHSAGSIYVQRFIEALDAKFGSQSNQTVEMITIAGAVTFERMLQGLPALQRRVSALRVFGLSDRREGGYWEVPFIYNKSLLYIVSSLCEGDSQADRPLLGMQRYWSGSKPYDQSVINAIKALINPARSAWSPTASTAAPGYRSDADRHGGFPEESQTNQSVCYALQNGF